MLRRFCISNKINPRGMLITAAALESTAAARAPAVTAGTISLRTGLIDHNTPAIQWGIMHCSYCFLRARFCCHFNKPETLGLTRKFVKNNIDRNDFSRFRKAFLQIFRRYFVGHIAHIQLCTHTTLLFCVYRYPEAAALWCGDAPLTFSGHYKNAQGCFSERKVQSRSIWLARKKTLEGLLF